MRNYRTEKAGKSSEMIALNDISPYQKFSTYSQDQDPAWSFGIPEHLDKAIHFHQEGELVKAQETKDQAE